MKHDSTQTEIRIVTFVHVICSYNCVRSVLPIILPIVMSIAWCIAYYIAYYMAYCIAYYIAYYIAYCVAFLVLWVCASEKVEASGFVLPRKLKVQSPEHWVGMTRWRNNTMAQ